MLFENSSKQLSDDIKNANDSINRITEIRNNDNSIEMGDTNQQLPISNPSEKLFSDLFKVNENSTITEPLQNIMNILSNNEEEKRKREYNLLVFGLKVSNNDKSYATIKKLLDDIGVNYENIHSVAYLKKKDVVNELAPIKLIAYNIESKFIILKAARKLKIYNELNNTKISISLDLSEIDRQLNKSLIIQRNANNALLSAQDNFYFGIRSNVLVKIPKRAQL